MTIVRKVIYLTVNIKYYIKKMSILILRINIKLVLFFCKLKNLILYYNLLYSQN